MDDTQFFTARNVLTLLDAPTSLVYPERGGVRVEKAGISGAGRTAVDAAADWCHRFAAMVTLPRDPPEDGDGYKDGEDTDLIPGEGRAGDEDE